MYVEHTAAVQFEVLQQHLSLDELIHAHVQLQEYQHLVAYDAACRRSGKRCLRTTNIMDFRGLGLSSFTTFVRHLVMRVSTVNQNHYPEGLVRPVPHKHSPKLITSSRHPCTAHVNNNNASLSAQLLLPGVFGSTQGALCPDVRVGLDSASA